MKKNIESKIVLFCVSLAIAACGCSQESGSTTDGSSAGSMTETQAKPAAIAKLKPTQGNKVEGTVTFYEAAKGLRVVAHITGLTPGEHGFHVHEHGDCSAPDASSAGGHFNPTSVPHGAPGAEQHHIGDLGNVNADAEGHVHLDKVFPFLTVAGENSIVGRGLIVHAGRDDLTSQPTGDAGGRVACGVIEKQ
jgi:Cu-Zn family superoxide dismutase